MSDNQPFDPTATSIFGLAPVTEDVEEAPVALSARDREAVEALPAGSALLISVHCFERRPHRARFRFAQRYVREP